MNNVQLGTRDHLTKNVSRCTCDNNTKIKKEIQYGSET